MFKVKKHVYQTENLIISTINGFFACNIVIQNSVSLIPLNELSTGSPEGYTS